MVVLDAINVYRVTTIIPIVFRAIVQHWAVFQQFVMLAENVHVYQVLLENSAHNVVPDIMHIQNVFVSTQKFIILSLDIKIENAILFQYVACNCETHGSIGISCNNDGQCLCSNNFDSKTCDQCKEGFYNFPACEE